MDQGNLRSHQREWCPQGCGASASHGRAGTRTPRSQFPSTRSMWRGEELCGKSTSAHTQRVKDEKRSVRRARTEAQRGMRGIRRTKIPQSQMPSTMARKASLEQKQFLWRCSRTIPRNATHSHLRHEGNDGIYVFRRELDTPASHSATSLGTSSHEALRQNFCYVSRQYFCELLHIVSFVVVPRTAFLLRTI